MTTATENKSGASQTADGRGIAPDAREAASSQSEGVGQGNPAPDAGNAADKPVGGSSATTPRQVLENAVMAALGIEAAGTLLAQAVGRMIKADSKAHGRKGKAERDATWVREWREVLANLDSHANAMTAFLGGFMAAPCFRRTARAAHEQELAERRAEVLAELAGGEPQGAGRGGAE